MAKNDKRLVRDPHQKKIVELFSRFDGSKNRRKIFEDFITMSAIALSNVVDKTHFDEREQRYLDIAKQYSKEELETFAEMNAHIVMGMDDNPNQDFLGEMYMNLNFGSETTGQFFTPYSVCRVMAEVTTNFEHLEYDLEEKGFVSVTDPACGAGATLIAFANTCKEYDINYQEKVLFVAQDIDEVVGLMCYLALSYMGCPGYVVIGNSLTNPTMSFDKRSLLPKDDGNIWRTPMFQTHWMWQGRQQAAMMDLLLSGFFDKKENVA